MYLKFLAISIIIIAAVSAFVLVSPFSGMTGMAIGGGPEYECPNCSVLFITLDTVRADHMSLYGYFQETTPNIDEFGKESVVFDNAFTNIPFTPSAHWSMFTGFYPFEHRKFLPTERGEGLTTIMDMLEDEGYATAAFTSSAMVHGFSEEFDNFDGNTGIMKRKKVHRERYGGKDGKYALEGALSWLEEHAEEDFFLWVHFYDPHAPYEPPLGYDIFDYSDVPEYSDPKYMEEGLTQNGTILRDLETYDGEILYTDHLVSILLEKFDELGIRENTLIVIVSDHGECFGEHKYSDYGYEKKMPNEYCVSHTRTLYDAELHVPIIINNPKSEIGGKRIPNMVELVDIFPTILELLNVETGIQHSGESLVGLVRGLPRTKDYVFSQTDPRPSVGLSLGIMKGEWKFITFLLSRSNTTSVGDEMTEYDMEMIESGAGIDVSKIKKMLFNTVEGENSDFIEQQPSIANSLEEFLSTIVPFSRILGISVRIDSATRELLLSLGYMQ